MNKTSLQSILHEERVILPSSSFQSQALIKSQSEYQAEYQQSLLDPATFWLKMAQEYFWNKEPSRACEFSFGASVFIKWFEDGSTNLCYNALDRHLDTKADKTAFIYVPNEGEAVHISFKKLYAQVCYFANGLKKMGLKKGDRVALYMPMIPEAAVAMLACARLGIVHNVVFGGFSAQSLKDRILDSGATTLVTSNELLRGSKTIALKDIADEAMELCSDQGHIVSNCVVYLRTDTECEMMEDRDHFWHDFISEESPVCDVEWVDAEDPLFMLYTSGSTGKPKGVLHTTGGYMVYAGATFKYLFDLKDDDIYFCTADVGWITGHTYLVYGPLLNGCTSVLFEGVPTYPKGDRLWEIVEDLQVTKFYTAPTAIRALMKLGDEFPKKHNLTSLKLLGTVGEPINPEAWMWYYQQIGGERCPVIDTYWQTETGGVLVSAFPGATPLKPGSATVPFFGVNCKVLRPDGTECDVNEGGHLVVDKPWPGIMRTVYQDHKRFEETYFSAFPGHYYTGDGARIDEDGYIWLMGRMDDVLNVSGHRLGTAEIESALVAHESVAESAVVGFPHDIKGQGVYAYVTLIDGVTADDDLLSALKEHVKKEIGSIAKPDVIHFSNSLPKTRSGKIMRRILRKIAAGQGDDLGDVSTLADPDVVEMLLKENQELFG